MQSKNVTQATIMITTVVGKVNETKARLLGLELAWDGTVWYVLKGFTKKPPTWYACPICNRDKQLLQTIQ